MVMVESLAFLAVGSGPSPEYGCRRQQPGLSALLHQQKPFLPKLPELPLPAGDGRTRPRLHIQAWLGTPSADARLQASSWRWTALSTCCGREQFIIGRLLNHATVSSDTPSLTNSHIVLENHLITLFSCRPFRTVFGEVCRALPDLASFCAVTW